MSRLIAASFIVALLLFNHPVRSDELSNDLFSQAVVKTGTPYLDVRQKIIATENGQAFLQSVLNDTSNSPTERWTAEILLARMTRADDFEKLEKELQTKSAMWMELESDPGTVGSENSIGFPLVFVDDENVDLEMVLGVRARTIEDGQGYESEPKIIKLPTLKTLQIGKAERHFQTLWNEFAAAKKLSDSSLWRLVAAEILLNNLPISADQLPKPIHVIDADSCLLYTSPSPRD